MLLDTARRQQIDALVAERFDGNPKKLAVYGIQPQDEQVAELLKDAMGGGGKRLRANLLQAWYEACGGKEQSASHEAAIIVELVHMGTLLIDDVQDQSPLRRGKPSFHIKHGEAVAISTGLLMLYMAQHAARKLHNGDAIALLVGESLRTLAAGQLDDVLWQAQTNTTVSTARYARMTAEKTGALFAFCIAAAGELANKKASAQVLQTAETMGILFQLSDDLLNLDPLRSLGKEYAEDVRERKITAILLAAMNTAGEKDKDYLLSTYKKKQISEAEVKKVVGIFQRTGAIKAVQEHCDELKNEIHSQILLLEVTEQQRVLLQAFTDAVRR
jgi:geranylgeranyl pyrophosphate synthase